MADAHANFAFSTVATAPSPATSGTSLVVAAGQGSRFPAVPFNAVVCPIGLAPDSSNAEIIRVTALSTDTFSTITRAQEGTTARAITVGDQVIAGPTKKWFDDIESTIVAGHTSFVTTIPGAFDTDYIAPGFANVGYGVRVVMPKTGNLRDVSWMPQLTGGNYDIGVLDTNGSSRTLLASRGSTAVGTAGVWQTWDPNLAVTIGQELDLVLSFSSTTPRVCGIAVAYDKPSRLPTGFIPTSGGADAWNFYQTFSAFPLVGLLEANFSTTFFLPLIVARIS